MTNVIGLDLSITATGFADVGGVVSTIKTKLDGDMRLNEIRDRLADQFQPAVTGIDGCQRNPPAS